MKKVIFGGVLLVLLYALWLLMYGTMLSSANEEWYQEWYVDQKIVGELHWIHEYSDNPSRLALRIKNSVYPTDLSYGVVCASKELKDYIAIGDSINKQQGSKTLFFCKNKNDCKEFELIFCE